METKKYPEFKSAGIPSFEEAWEYLIGLPLKGQNLPNSRGANTIIDINWRGVTRKSSRNNISDIDIELFRFAYNEILEKGFVLGDYINEQVHGGCSTCILSVFKKLPHIVPMVNKRGVELKRP